MNRADYIEILQDRLKDLPENEIEEAIRYVEEYFDEAGEENFYRSMDELGSPYRFANQVRADVVSKANYSKNDKQESYKKGRQSSNIWIIILGILSLPISFPLFISMIVLMISLGVVILSLLIAGAAVMFSGIAVLFYGLFRLPITLYGGLTILAVSFILIGFSLIMISLLTRLSKKVLPALSKWLGNLFQKIKEKVS